MKKMAENQDYQAHYYYEPVTPRYKERLQDELAESLTSGGNS